MKNLDVPAKTVNGRKLAFGSQSQAIDYIWFKTVMFFSKIVHLLLNLLKGDGFFDLKYDIREFIMRGGLSR